MDERQKSRAGIEWFDRPPGGGPWTLARLDIASTMRPKRWPIAQVELVHRERGRILEIGTGAGCLDAAFNAVAQLTEITAPVASLVVQYKPRRGEGALPDVIVEIEAIVDGVGRRGRARTGDLLLSAVGAYLNAIGEPDRRQRSPQALPCVPGSMRWEGWK